MIKLHQDLWILQTPFKLFGVNFRNCMTAIRVDNSLILHSPVAFSPEIELPEANVDILLAPNRFHTLFFPEWKQAYPHATIYAPTKKVKYHKRLDVASVEALNTRFAPDLWFHLVQGLPGLSEVVCIHRPSKTLVLTDLCFNQRSGSLWTRLAFRAYGSFGSFGPTRLMRYLINKDPKAFKSSLQTILQQDFQRIIVSHGDMVENDAKDNMVKAFSWLNLSETA